MFIRSKEEVGLSNLIVSIPSKNSLQNDRGRLEYLRRMIHATYEIARLQLSTRKYCQDTMVSINCLEGAIERMFEEIKNEELR